MYGLRSKRPSNAHSIRPWTYHLLFAVDSAGAQDLMDGVFCVAMAMPSCARSL
jgi:hypothetical protein